MLALGLLPPRALQQTYGARPEAVARAPGRVNLIGEHIDYMGFGVLPCAIEKSVTIAVGRASAASNGEIAI
jgi:galactokinase